MDKPIDYKALANALVEQSRYIYSINITQGKSIEEWWKSELKQAGMRNASDYQEWESPYYGPA